MSGTWRIVARVGFRCRVLSISMTSAPRSARYIVAYGPAQTMPWERMRTPSRGRFAMTTSFR